MSVLSRSVVSTDADDLLALADAVREVGFTWDDPPPAPAASAAPAPRVTRRRGHLAVVADPADPHSLG